MAGIYHNNENLYKTGESAPSLTPRDWGEIYYALLSKQVAVDNGDYGEDNAIPDAYGTQGGWSKHLEEIIGKIGPDGENMYQPVEP